VGVSQDSEGRLAYRLALQTREQHIRREKATSNICTAQALLAIMAGFYASYHGLEGLKRIAIHVCRKSSAARKGLEQAGYNIPVTSIFDTVIVDTPDGAQEIHKRARELGLNLREIDASHVGFSVDETTTPEIVEKIWSAFGCDADFSELSVKEYGELPKNFLRQDAILEHPVFSSYRTETEMMRYMRRLMDRDLALDRSMIPLGSCTMKLNASTEMYPVLLDGFANIHPFAPADQKRGYKQMISELEDMLCSVTGYDAVSMQPNSGAQGEYAGLLAIRAYHQSRGEHDRRVCLIPSSAHGTNPASAHLAGMDVVVIKCNEQGDVDISDLESKAGEYSDRLAAIMVTYPSTHGVFEEGIRRICDIVHENGGQVYVDGANLNAQIGLTRLGEIGADVSHLNLHKTFCIPHGGGGPGVGPIGVKSHLAPFLPGHFTCRDDERKGRPIAAAAQGSAGILPISYSYIKLMGGAG
ncbi:MAG: glycine dehydrogenase (aminomethyl-transferring), partial [Desulfobulbia bacterium]